MLRASLLAILFTQPACAALSAIHVRTRVVASAAPRTSAAKPVVGIYPTDGSYIPAYQQWVEQFGAATLVLPKFGGVYDYFPKLNALLIPGGSGDVEPFARSLIRRAMLENREGNFFPVWGTCLGFEWLIQAIAADDRILQNGFLGIDAQRLIFNGETFPGRMFQSANESLRYWFRSQKLTSNAHVLGIEPRSFARNAGLAETFDILAYSTDSRGRMYVAAIEGKSLPFYGVQFHPEKIRYAQRMQRIPFMDVSSRIPNSPEAMAASDHFASFFVEEARKNAYGKAERAEEKPVSRRAGLRMEEKGLSSDARNSVQQSIGMLLARWVSANSDGMCSLSATGLVASVFFCLATLRFQAHSMCRRHVDDEVHSVAVLKTPLFDL